MYNRSIATNRFFKLKSYVRKNEETFPKFHAPGVIYIFLMIKKYIRSLIIYNVHITCTTILKFNITVTVADLEIFQGGGVRLIKLLFIHVHSNHDLIVMLSDTIL